MGHQVPHTSQLHHLANLAIPRKLNPKTAVATPAGLMADLQARPVRGQVQTQALPIFPPAATGAQPIEPRTRVFSRSQCILCLSSSKCWGEEVRSSLHDAWRKMVPGQAHEQHEDLSCPQNKATMDFKEPPSNEDWNPIFKVYKNAVGSRQCSCRSSITLSRKFWPGKCRNLLKLAQHNLPLVAFRFSLILFWRQKMTPFLPWEGKHFSEGWLIAVT